MSKHWAKLGFISAVMVLTAQAAHADGKTGVTGSIEAGWGWGSTPTGGTGVGASGTAFFVDQVNLSHHFHVNDKTSVTVHNAMAVNGNGAAGVPTAGHNGSNYLSGTARLAAGSMVFANQGAYLTHQCADGLYTSVGHLATPFGMESMAGRYNMASYFYSSSMTRAYTADWMYDLGINWHLKDIIPGSLEFSILDGRNTNALGSNDASNTPSVALRYSHTIKSGDWSLTPQASTYLGKWRGGPSDLGISAGAGFKMGAMWVNTEFLYTSFKVGGLASSLKDTQWGVVVEPGFDLGMAEFSLKGEFYNNKNEGIDTTSNSNINVGAAISKTYDEKFRVKLAYMHNNFSRKGATSTSTVTGPSQIPANDLRLLFATAF